jgi:hypothetical protein
VDGLLFAFIDIHAKAKGYTEKRLESADVIILNSQAMAYVVNISENDSEAMFMMQQEQFSNLDLELTDPSGEKVTSQYPGAVYSGPNNHPEYFIVANPKPGAWRMTVVGQDVPYEIPYIVYSAAKPKEPKAKANDLLLAGLGLTAIISVIAAVLLAVMVVAAMVWLMRKRGRKLKT